MASYAAARKIEDMEGGAGIQVFKSKAAAGELGLVKVKALDARVVVFGNCKSDNLMWLEQVLPSCSYRTVSESYTADVSPARSDYDVLVVAGNDVKRLRQFIRIYRPLLNSKPKLALISGALPRDRALLLNAGFDDVFDPRMAVPEGQARAVAIANRYRDAAERQAKKLVVNSSIVSEYVSDDFQGNLNLRETSILLTLIAHSPRAVPTHKLRNTMARRPEISVPTLRVVLSSIRSKLVSSLEIVAIFPNSYALINKEIEVIDK